jgi:hypothetical protein
MIQDKTLTVEDAMAIADGVSDSYFAGPFYAPTPAVAPDGPNILAGCPLFAYYRIDTVHTDVAVTLEVICASDAALTTDIVSVGTFPSIDTTATTGPVEFALPQNLSDPQLYWGFRWSNVTGSGGAAKLWFGLEPDVRTDYHDNRSLWNGD